MNDTAVMFFCVIGLTVAVPHAISLWREHRRNVITEINQQVARARRTE